MSKKKSNRKGMVGRISAVRSKTMAAVKSKDSKSELALRRFLHRSGLRFRVHSKKVFGKPDIVFSKARVAVFCDGDFWHGKTLDKLRDPNRIMVRKGYWIGKIQGNVIRDKQVNRILKKSGWMEIRVWESDILKDSIGVAAMIINAVNGRLARQCNRPEYSK